MTESEYRATCKVWGEGDYRPSWDNTVAWPAPITVQGATEAEFHFGGRWATFAEDVYTPWCDAHPPQPPAEGSGGVIGRGPPKRPPKRD